LGIKYVPSILKNKKSYIKVDGVGVLSVPGLRILQVNQFNQYNAVHSVSNRCFSRSFLFSFLGAIGVWILEFMKNKISLPTNVRLRLQKERNLTFCK
jgi:hypothetical protein